MNKTTEMMIKYGRYGSPSTSLDYGSVYEFCLDWQMNMISKCDLCKQFIENNWDWSEFTIVAKNQKWFVNSMYALIHAQDFGG
jgi:hypothetical protein